MDSDWERIEAVFHQAADLSPALRSKFLEQECSGDVELLKEVESLLAADTPQDQSIRVVVEEAFHRVLPDASESRSRIGVRLGHYVISDLIATGGMGAVYHAVRVDDFQMQVAIKVIRRAENIETARARFFTERQTIAALEHPNIARLLDGGTTEDRLPYLVMEYVDGLPVDEWCSSRNLSTDERLTLFRQVCAAVQHAHDRGIIHRDIKPANILVRSDGTPKLLDFGVAAFQSAEAIGRMADPAPMTPAYASPEQVRGEPVGAASDVYSMGVTLYRILTGVLPDDPTSVPRRGIERDLYSILIRAMQQAPERRYASVAEFADDLDRFQRSLPVHAGKQSSTYRLRKFIGRHRAEVIAAGCSALVMLAVVVGMSRLGTPRVSAADSVQSLAVLPLENRSPRADQQYFADGMTDALIGNLAHVPGLRVISRTSVIPYRNRSSSLPVIARTLGVDTIAEGSVALEDGQVRVEVRLVDARADRPVWTGSYEGEVRDILALQDHVAQAIASEFGTALAPANRSHPGRYRRVNLDAYDEYLKGRQQYLSAFTRGNIEGAIARFRSALKRDEGYAPAYAGLADAYYMLSSMYYPPTEMMPRARAAAMKALELDDELAEAQATLALVESLYSYEREQADKRFRRALELKPSDAVIHLWYGMHLLAMGHFAEAVAEMDEAQRLDPGSPGVDAYRGAAMYLSRNYDGVIELMTPVTGAHPEYHHPHAWLALAYEQKRDFGKAIAEMERAFALDHESEALAQLGHIYASAGQREKAVRALESLFRARREKYVSSYNLAVLYAGLGRTDEAFRYLLDVTEDRGEWFAFAGVDPRLDSLRSNPRFTGVLRSVGLTH